MISLHTARTSTSALNVSGKAVCRIILVNSVSGVAGRTWTSEKAFWPAGACLAPSEARSIGLSAVRSFLFNEILDRRVRDGSWQKILPGELANLDGSGSVFAVDELTPELQSRCATFDIHPTATLWGRHAPLAGGSSATLQEEVTAAYKDLCSGLENFGMDAASRSLRLRVSDLKWDIADGVLWLEFSLRKGSYATAVLREIVAL